MLLRFKMHLCASLILGNLFLFTICRISCADAEENVNFNTQQNTESIVVKGSRQRIVAKYSTAATKDNTSLIESPESVSVVTRTQIDMQNARSLNEVLRYTSGVATGQRGANTRYDQMTIRGFGARSGVDEYVDGMRLFNGQTYGVQQIDPYLLERVEVLKGPASVLYGQSSPAGIIALTSKVANASRIRHISLEGGNYNYGRGTIDLGDIITESGSLSWRIVATAFRQDALDHYTKSDRYAFQPSINWKPDDKTSLTVYTWYQADPESNSNQFFPIYGTVLPGTPHKFNSHSYIGDLNFQGMSRTQEAVGYSLTHDFNSNWKATSLLRYAALGSNYNQVTGADYKNKNSSAGLVPGNDYMNRLAVGSKEHFDSVTLEERLNGKIHTGSITHNLMIGVSWENLRSDYSSGTGAAPNLNFFNPSYHQHINIPQISNAAGVSTNQEGIFLQDQLSYRRIHVQLGFRNDWSAIHTRDHIGTNSFSQSDQAFTFRGGILYALSQGISPYFHYTQSFQPLNQLDHNSKPFQPTRGEQYEVGIKYQPKNFEGFFTAALYNLTQSNVLTVDPQNALWNVQAGAIRSRGIELEAHTTPLPGWNIIAAYTFDDVRYTKDNTNLIGRRPVQVPSQLFSLYTEYTIQSGKLEDLGGGIGIRYVGNTMIDTQTLIKTPSYTLIDAQMHYRLYHLLPTLRGVIAQLTAQNLFNKQYIATCNSQLYGCFWGEGRTVIGRLSYDW